jgi:hypothetical protein
LGKPAVSRIASGQTYPNEHGRAQRQRLWKSDLNRTGIRCVLVESYGRLKGEQVVVELSQMRRDEQIR